MVTAMSNTSTSASGILTSYLQEQASSWVDTAPDEVKEAIESLGGVSKLQIQPVGHWIRHIQFCIHPNPYMDNYFKRWVVCSNCNFTRYLPEGLGHFELYESTACPCCCAVMDLQMIEEIKHESQGGTT